MTKTLLIAASLLTVSFASVACDSPEDDETTVVTRQLQEADLPLEDALAAVAEVAPDAIAIEAKFTAGVSSGFYEILAIEGSDLVTLEVEADADRPEAREVARRRAGEERLARARAHRHFRRRLAAALADHRGRQDTERPIRARLMDRDVEVDLRDSRGNERRIQLAFE